MQNKAIKHFKNKINNKIIKVQPQQRTDRGEEASRRHAPKLVGDRSSSEQVDLAAHRSASTSFHLNIVIQTKIRQTAKIKFEIQTYKFQMANSLNAK